MKHLRNSKGFTLIEMVVVIVILGIIAGVAIPQFVDLQTDAQAANNMAYIGSLRSALAMRIAEQLMREGNDTAGTNDDVVGNAATADVDQNFLEGRITTPTSPPSTLTGSGATDDCSIPATWTSTVDIQGFTTPTFTLTCGGNATAPVTIVCSAPAGCGAVL